MYYKYNREDIFPMLYNSNKPGFGVVGSGMAFFNLGYSFLSSANYMDAFYN